VSETYRGWRYGSRTDRERCRVPDGVALRVRMVGGREQSVEYDGRMFFRMTEGHLEVVDPAGAGVIARIERGLVREMEVAAC
jgi:hypothetical protein